MKVKQLFHDIGVRLRAASPRGLSPQIESAGGNGPSKAGRAAQGPAGAKPRWGGHCSKADALVPSPSKKSGAPAGGAGTTAAPGKTLPQLELQIESKRAELHQFDGELTDAFKAFEFARRLDPKAGRDAEKALARVRAARNAVDDELKQCHRTYGEALGVALAKDAKVSLSGLASSFREALQTLATESVEDLYARFPGLAGKFFDTADRLCSQCVPGATLKVSYDDELSDERLAGFVSGLFGQLKQGDAQHTRFALAEPGSALTEVQFQKLSDVKAKPPLSA
jgi:hypothetical protein